jgi:hypothetical protein
MQYFKTLSLFLILSIFLACGGGGDTKKTTSSDTAPAPVVLAVLNILNSTPANGNGTINVTAVTSDVNISGGDQVIHISGTTGATDALIQHQIDIHYYIYFQGNDTLAQVTMVTHAWGTTLANSIDGGISVCQGSCPKTAINPTANTLIFDNQILSSTANPSTVQGTVVYP